MRSDIRQFLESIVSIEHNKIELETLRVLFGGKRQQAKKLLEPAPELVITEEGFIRCPHCDDDDIEELEFTALEVGSAVEVNTYTVKHGNALIKTFTGNDWLDIDWLDIDSVTLCAHCIKPVSVPGWAEVVYD